MDERDINCHKTKILKSAFYICKVLKFNINHQPIFDIRNYIGEDGDRVLISFGKETMEELEAQLLSLDAQTLKHKTNR